MAIAQNFPEIRPSLNLDFSNVKALDPRVTFARASSATYYGTETAKAEENLWLQSQALATSPWIGLRVNRTNNADTAPDGTTTATRVTQASGQTTFGNVNQNVTTEANSTVSVFAKPDGKNFIVIQTTSSPVRRTWFDVDNGTVGATNADHTASIVDAGNGWYRCIVTAASGTAAGPSFYIADADNSQTVVDSGSVLFWGAQVEQRSAVTAYTPTTNQPITRFQPVLELEPAGVARFDHNPITGESLGLLVEEQRTNLLTRSEEFDDAGWAKSNATITANTIVAPSGELTGDKLVENDASGTHGSSQNATVVDGTTHTVSLYAKSGERTKLAIRFGTAGGGGTFLGRAEFDLQVGTVQNQTSITSASITHVGNGWYRCTATDVSSGTTLGIGIFLIESGTTTTYTGDGFSGVFIWGASLEQAAFPTSYIKTVASQVTRAADSASMTGANFSSWFSNAEGTIYSEATLKSVLSDVTLYSIDDGTTGQANQIDTRIATNITTLITSYRPRVRVYGVSVADLSPNQFTFGTSQKLAFGFALDNFGASQEGQTAVTDTDGTIPSNMNRLNIGTRGTGAVTLTGTIKKLSYYPQRLSDVQLQGLTS